MSPSLGNIMFHWNSDSFRTFSADYCPTWSTRLSLFIMVLNSTYLKYCTHWSSLQEKVFCPHSIGSPSRSHHVKWPKQVKHTTTVSNMSSHSRLPTSSSPIERKRYLVWRKSLSNTFLINSTTTTVDHPYPSCLSSDEVSVQTCLQRMWWSGNRPPVVCLDYSSDLPTRSRFLLLWGWLTALEHLNSPLLGTECQRKWHLSSFHCVMQRAV